jgi:hypothetical protein
MVYCGVAKKVSLAFLQGNLMAGIFLRRPTQKPGGHFRVRQAVSRVWGWSRVIDKGT